MARAKLCAIDYKKKGFHIDKVSVPELKCGLIVKKPGGGGE